MTNLSFHNLIINVCIPKSLYFTRGFLLVLVLTETAHFVIFVAGGAPAPLVPPGLLRGAKCIKVIENQLENKINNNQS